MIIKIGTRKSKLALIQTNLAIEAIKAFYPDLECMIVPINTTGDIINDKPLYDIGGKGLFLKELEIALLNKTIDVAVHSLKDVPGTLDEKLPITSVLKREFVNDVLLSNKAKDIKQLPYKAVIGTSSMRRSVLLRKIRPDLQILNIRGNVDSRVAKLLNNNLDAMILSEAGLKRLGVFDGNFCFNIPIEDMLPAVGQGVIALQQHINNAFVHEISNKINDSLTWNIISAERSFLSYLNADCDTPVAAYANMLNDNTMNIKFMLATKDGSKILYHNEECDINEANQVSIEVAKKMLSEI